MRKEKIIDMLNCNQSKKVQDLGIKYALQEKEKSFLLYYAEDIQYSDNCAKIFASMSYNESEIYMDELDRRFKHTWSNNNIRVFNKLSGKNTVFRI